ncbi:MAG: TIGR02281 family clan AA aspartic protease [Burkholderiales bacterium]
MSIGQTTAEGVKLVEAQSDNATFDVEGKRQTLRIGQYVGAPQTSGDDKVILKVEQGGHFYANAKVNGGSMRFLVDTGATMIAISTLDARRLGVSYLSAPTGRVQTANGVRMAWKVKLDTVSIGSITLNNIDATVLDGGLMTPLLGMSFLSRTSMQHEGDTLTMIKRF